MNGLFISLYLDEDVDTLLAKLHRLLLILDNVTADEMANAVRYV